MRRRVFLAIALAAAGCGNSAASRQAPADGPAFWVVVQPEHALDVVTLLSFFSPNAELTAGVGF